MDNNRPSDVSAQETVKFFEEMLIEDYKVKSFSLNKNDDNYILSYTKNDELLEKVFDAECAEKLWQDIENEPNYNIDA